MSCQWAHRVPKEARKPHGDHLAPCQAHLRTLLAGEVSKRHFGPVHGTRHSIHSLHPLSCLSVRYEEDPSSKTRVVGIRGRCGNHCARATVPGHSSERQLKAGMLRGRQDTGAKRSPEPINAWKNSQHTIVKLDNPAVGWHTRARSTPQCKSTCITSRRQDNSEDFSPQREPNPQPATFSIQPVSLEPSVWLFAGP